LVLVIGGLGGGGNLSGFVTGRGRAHELNIKQINTSATFLTASSSVFMNRRQACRLSPSGAMGGI
jgi:hypothetical protein